MLKPTQYAKSFCYGNACYIHNMINGETLSFPIRYFDRINALFSNQMRCIDSISNGLLATLADKGFFVDESECEAERVYMSVVENSHAHTILNVTILVTEECNFSCVYCGQNHRPLSMSITTATEVSEFIMQELKNKKYESVFVNWFGGEPLLRIDIVSFISNRLQSFCSQQHIAYGAGITTNGYLLTPDLFEYLLQKHKVINYQVTIDGGGLTHNTQRQTKDGKETFTTILHNLKLISLRNKHRTWRIAIRTNVTALFTGEAVNEYISVAHQFSNDKRFSFLIREAWGVDESFAFTVSQHQEMCSALSRSAISDHNMLYDFSLGRMMCHSCFLNSLTIDHNGYLLLCENIDNDEIASLGSIHDRESSRMYQKNGIPDLILCHNCVYYPCCLGYSCSKEYHKNGTIKGNHCQSHLSRLFELASAMYHVDSVNTNYDLE